MVSTVVARATEYQKTQEQIATRNSLQFLLETRTATFQLIDRDARGEKE